MKALPAPKRLAYLDWPLAIQWPPLFNDRHPMSQLEAWHDGRCAMCESTQALVTDHNHHTLMVRGKLCRSCNILEAHAYGGWTDWEWATYRQFPPAYLLQLPPIIYQNGGAHRSPSDVQMRLKEYFRMAWATRNGGTKEYQEMCRAANKGLII